MKLRFPAGSPSSLTFAEQRSAQINSHPLQSSAQVPPPPARPAHTRISPHAAERVPQFFRSHGFCEGGSNTMPSQHGRKPRPRFTGNGDDRENSARRSQKRSPARTQVEIHDRQISFQRAIRHGFAQNTHGIPGGVGAIEIAVSRRDHRLDRPLHRRIVRRKKYREALHTSSVLFFPLPNT